MTDSFVTQCPQCRTSFRVSRAQLGAAHGAVRCGACLHVFNAAQQLQHELARAVAPAVELAPLMPAPSPPVAPAPPANAEKKASDTLWIHDDLDLDSLDLDEELAKLEQQEQQFSQEFLALERNPKPLDNPLKTREPAHDKHDEGWAEALLADETPAPLVPRSIPSLMPRTPEVAPTVSIPPRPTPLLDVGEPGETWHKPASTAPAPAAALTLGAEADPAPFGGARTGARKRLEDAPEAAAEESEQRDEPPENEAPPPRAARRERRARERPAPAIAARSEADLFDLAEEPLQLDWQPPSKPWGRWIGWGLLNLLGIAALSGQYLWYHFDELARQDQYRPWFEQLCPSLGCSLPSKVDISLIKSSNLVVRSHPEFTGALVVDAILYNRAPFAQPFPLLEMRFADINSQLLASRRFKPSEYLAGELAGQLEMPPQTPIHISLDILDPGIKAVNYSLSFHSPE
ncbi:MAG: DUF3426 domain-containing protein [Pseudomonas sp.]|uniref:DUF3426 domain-containing protein n=1 Tax=Pseudomonas sp. TaxID=306 RepID=UPI003395AEBF